MFNFFVSVFNVDKIFTALCNPYRVQCAVYLGVEGVFPKNVLRQYDKKEWFLLIKRAFSFKNLVLSLKKGVPPPPRNLGAQGYLSHFPNLKILAGLLPYCSFFLLNAYLSMISRSYTNLIFLMRWMQLSNCLQDYRWCM